MSEIFTKYDEWLNGNEGPAALVLREYLMPVEGYDGVVFPPTFAEIGYNIDYFEDGSNICLIDSVGSQANRIEPIFAEESYLGLIPQIVIRAGKKEINLVEIGHRAGDALARCSALQEELHAAFQQVLMGNAEPLAKIAPTSLVFGVWDSRDTQAKLPRLVSSTIRAFNVKVLTRSAQFVPATEFVSEGLLDEPKDKKTKDAYAEKGFIHVPAVSSHGGVIATNGIRRNAKVSLSALQLVGTMDSEKTKNLRRYIFSLALVAITTRTPSYLRQGCDLVLDPQKPVEFEKVYRNGRRESFALSHEDAITFAKAAADVFGIGDDKIVDFDKMKAKEDVKKKD